MSLVENYIHEYLENLQPFCEGELGQLQKTSYEKEVPIIPKDVVQFLGVVLSIIKPKNRYGSRIFSQLYDRLSSRGWPFDYY